MYQHNNPVLGNAAHPAGARTGACGLAIAFLFPKLSKAEEKMLMEKRLKQLEQEQDSQSKK